jgi:Flp pilus assembly CpaE family ATPase
MLRDSPPSSKGTKTIIVAPPTEAGIIAGYLDAQIQPDGSAVFNIIAREQEIGPELISHLTETLAEVVVLHGSTPGFTTENIRAIVNLHGQRAKLVVAFVSPVGDWFDAVTDAGAIAYRMPVREEPFGELARELPLLLANARQQHAKRSLASAVEGQEEAEKMETPGAESKFVPPATGIRVPTQVITSWSSKGGDGKSLIAQELAWQLASVGGHKVLLVDSDMSRGYLAQALDANARRFAERHNITTLAQEFLVSGQITPEAFNEHLYAVPDINSQGESNLKALFGIASPEAATLPAYTANQGAQGARLINALVERAYGIYEFVIFDIGTAITIPVHYAAIKTAGHILVISTPTRTSVAPTREGIRQLESHQATTRDQLRLVINRWTPEAKLKRDELPEFFGIPLFATIPLVDPGMMMGLINEGEFISSAVWKDRKKYEPVQPFVVGVAALAENFVPGVVDAYKKKLGIGKKRSGLFGI